MIRREKNMTRKSVLESRLYASSKIACSPARRFEKLLITVSLLSLGLAPMVAEAQNPPPAGIPSTLDETEGPFSGVWTWNGSGYNATWNNGAIAILTVSSFTSASVVINRTDTSASVSAGLTAVYTGKISSGGNSIVNGSVTWTWAGVPGYPATGTWTASWAATAPPPPPTCSITSETLAHVPGTDDSTRALTGRIGAGENVVLSATPPGATSPVSATWTISSGHGTLTQDVTSATGFTSEKCDKSTAFESIVGEQACFIAPFSNDSTVVTAALSDGTGLSCSATLTTVQPTGLIFQRLKAPPLEAPGYGFHVPITVLANYLYGLEMWAAVFVTPGDVSFVNIGIAEEDISAPFTGTPSNVVAPIVEDNASLVGCDHDFNSSVFRPPRHPVTWDYTDGSSAFATATKVPFSRSQTTLSHEPDQDYVFEKAQVQALSANGTWVDTPDALGAELIVPRGSPDADLPSLGPTHLAAYQACVAFVKSQFGSIP
jgi:hypothetical protein